jgi:hypothetical protein
MRSTLLALLLAGCGLAQPSLTLIQDTLYQADGTKFQGMATISWSSFQASDLSNIAANTVRVPIVNGALRVRLVPTTNAAVPGSYSVVYNSSRVQFSETWAVPPSSVQLRVKDVRLSTGSLVGAGSLTSIQISDVGGLQNELLLRPIEGAGFATSRAAVINATGSIDGAAGNPGDCVHVDGTTGSCGSAGTGSFTYVDLETPGGTVDGSNLAFTLSRSPSPAVSLMVFRNGLLLRTGVDFTLANQLITFSSGEAPQPGDILQCSYRA